MAYVHEHYIVAIGASAGGLEAIHEFFDHMPDGANLSFVIVQHLSSDYKSLLVELLSRHTHMKVSEAGNDMELEKNCIYVIPNNKFIVIRRNRLLLEEKHQASLPNNAIDTFFFSLAREKKSRAIAIVLSGTGSDGSKGVEAVKAANGMVIVQDPTTAKFDGMPNSALALGIADHVLTPAEMPAEIINYCREPMLINQEVSEEQIEEIFSLIHRQAGFDFHFYKLPTIIRRITRRMTYLNIQDLDEYIALLRRDEEECKTLGNDFLIGVTRFFRDKEAFAVLQEKLAEDTIPSKNEHDTIKVWVCACSTGEEAYSIGILLNELVERSGKSLDIKIFATDIDEASIDIAAKGVYPATIEKDVDHQLLEKYFIPKGSEYQISSRVRKQVVFARHDVIRNPPFINNDLVSCRNMLIYVSPHLQKKIYSLLMFSLSKNAYLFLGTSEHSTYIKDNVQEISSRWKIYKKIKDTKIASLYLTNIADRNPSDNDSRKSSWSGHAKKPQPIWEALKLALGEDLSLAAFFIDESFEIKETAGNYEKILTLPKKALKLNLLDMVPTELYFLLSAEVRKVWKAGNPVTLRNLRIAKKDRVVFWEVVIKPVRPYMLVVITEHDAGEALTQGLLPRHPASDSEPAEYIQRLEAELAEVKGNLDMAVEDLEMTNEELQSSNEELLSANEELQSSNEELQSLNEELHTLNTEHQLKIRELIELNDDLNNYFRSTDIAQIFLDKNLIIRRFNTASYDMINFIDSDVGRPLDHISNNIGYANFQADVRRALKNEMTEREVALNNGKNLLMRIMPYLNRERSIAGVIISFVDISVITQLNSTIRAVLNSSPGFILGFTAVRTGNRISDFTLQTINTAASRFLHRQEGELIGSSLQQDLSQLAADGLFEQYVHVAETGQQLQKDVFFKKEERWYNIIAAKMLDGFVVTYSDITSKKRAEQRLKKNYLELVTAKNNLKTANEQLENKIIERTMELGVSEERFRLVARATNDALWEWNLVNNTMWLGETFFKLFGYKDIGPETNRNFWLNNIYPDDKAMVSKSLQDAINSGGSQWSIEYRFAKESGEYAFILDRGYILHDEFGTPYRMLGSMFDVTELKTAQQKLATMNERLEHKVAERTQELEQMNSALELSNNDLQQFASVASHDLQEPLRKIQMFAKLIQELYDDDPGNEAVQYVDKVLHSTRRMRSLITDILNYSRLSADDNKFESVDLNEMIRGIMDDFELTIREKSAVIHVAPLPKLEVISGQIRQVFQNLLSNALKFSQPGIPPVINITSTRLAKRSFMSMPQENGAYCLITVTDNGIGFDPQFAGKIFNLFHRLHSKDQFEGTGIGLAVTKRIIEKHNGLIRADSRENEGATFAMLLPVKQPK